MIRKRDNFLFFIPILIAAVVICSTLLLMYHVNQFGNSYIKDAEQELNSDIKQVLWVITPLLKDGDFTKITQYCDEFRNEKMRITVIKKDGKVIADSKTGVSTLENHLNRPEVKSAILGKTETTVRYSSTMQSEMVYKTTPILVDNNAYIIRVAVSAHNISDMLKKSENDIILTFLIGVGGVLLLTIYIFINVRLPFNKLQQSAIKIASGDLNAEIFTPKEGVLFELSRAINVMAKQLKRQIKNMKKMENFRSEFIANVSHEVKTPLTAILSAVEILNLQKTENPQQEKCLKIISDQANRLNRLIQDILSLADLEKKQIFKNRDFAELNVGSMLDNAVSLCQALAETNNVDIIIEKNEQIKIFGNQYLLEQAVNNLIVNAIKYSKTTKIVVNSYMLNKELKISVKDFGIGISKEESARIFERFYRIDKARSRELGGTGLGLAIVKNIAKLHNGKVEVMSELGSGAEFIITIPII